MLEVNNVTKKFKSSFFNKKMFTAVDNVSFHINEGESFGIIGESGSGKSTIGKMIINLYKPNEGEIKIDGKNIIKNKFTKTLEFKKQVQMIFQEPDGVFDPKWKIKKSMLEPYNIHTKLSHIKKSMLEPYNIHTKLSHDEKMEKIIHWLEIVGLSKEHLDRYPFELSGGQLQRLSFARVLMLEPKLIIADEPTSSLDVSVQAQVLTLMREIQQRLNLTILYVTHDLYLARQMCDRIAVMQKGKFVEQGRSDEVFDNPKEDYTKRLINAQLPPDLTSKEKTAV